MTRKKTKMAWNEELILLDWEYDFTNIKIYSWTRLVCHFGAYYTYYTLVYLLLNLRNHNNNINIIIDCITVDVYYYVNGDSNVWTCAFFKEDVWKTRGNLSVEGGAHWGSEKQPSHNIIVDYDKFLARLVLHSSATQTVHRNNPPTLSHEYGVFHQKPLNVHTPQAGFHFSRYDLFLLRRPTEVSSPRTCNPLAAQIAGIAVKRCEIIIIIYGGETAHADGGRSGMPFTERTGARARVQSNNKPVSAVGPERFSSDQFRIYTHTHIPMG